MSTARLSPAANLLRNSKLFALPPTVPLPQQKPAFEPIADSDTATTIHPTRAAVISPRFSYTKGDWGLKRELPAKATANTSTPVIRLRGQYDTQEHITDFESAGDHVLTLEKWRNVTMQMTRPQKQQMLYGDRRKFSVFHPDYDNTTSAVSIPATTNTYTTNDLPVHLQKSLAQLQRDREAKAEADGHPLPKPRKEQTSTLLNRKRWKYEGPWLAGMTNMEFEAYLKDLGNKTLEFREQIKSMLQKQKLVDAEAAQAAQTDTNGQKDVSQSRTRNATITESETAVEISEEEIDSAIRQLRQKPEAFGAEIASFLDLPEGPDPSGEVLRLRGSTPQWAYKRQTVSADPYRAYGPPRTHPSAGFSYVRTNQYARNDPVKGPSKIGRPLPGRILREQQPYDENKAPGGAPRVSVGVGGLIARVEILGAKTNLPPWQPTSGGPKLVFKVRDHNASVMPSGAIDLVVAKDSEHSLDENNMPLNNQDRAARERAKARAQMPSAPQRMPYLDDFEESSRNKRTEYRRHAPPEDNDNELSQLLGRLTSRKI